MALSPEFLPRLAKVSSSCGCTLTRATFSGLTPDAFEALSGSEVELARVIASSAEAKALGVQERGLPMLLKGSIKNVKPQLNTHKFEEQSIILPYIQRRQRQVLNANYWDVLGGVATATGGLPANTADFTIGLSTSTFRTPWTSIERFFLPGMTIIITTWDDAVNRTAKTYQYEIISSVNADAGGQARALVTAKPLGKAAPATIPSYGVVQVGANNISDWEYWCENQPTDNNMGLLVNWFQTSRESRCVSQVYKDTLQKILEGKLNAWDQSFNYLSLADQNKRAAQLSEDAWVRSVFYNDYLDANQTPETYSSLPTVEDPEQSGCTLEYKANALGFYTILGENQRILDLNGAALDIDQIFSELYTLKRHRQADGDQVSVIDSMTDRLTASLIYEVMSKYYKARYGVDTTRFAKLGEKVEFNGIVMFEYDLYDVPESGVQWAVFRDPFFDDHVSAHSATAAGGTAGAADDFQNRARQLWFLDWSDINVGIGGTNSVTRKNPDPNTSDLYRCRMQANVKEYNLRSTKWTVMLDRPSRHLLIQNFSLSCPTIQAGYGCDVPNP